MGRFRFSIAGQMGLVGLLAVGLAALKSANQLWTDLITTLVLGTLLFALLGLTHSTGAMRRFWSGFALFGWMYLILTQAPYFQRYVLKCSPGDGLLQYLHSKIATIQPPTTNSETVAIWVQPKDTYWVDGQIATDEKELRELVAAASSKKSSKTTWVYVDPNVDQMNIRRELQTVNQVTSATSLRMELSGNTTLSPEWSYFRRVGHSLFALVAGLIGGLLARFLLRRPEESVKGVTKGTGATPVAE